MSDETSDSKSVWRTPRVIIAIAAAALILIIWLFAFFLPSNSKVSSYHAQLPELQAKQAKLNAEVVQLQKVAKAQAPLTAKLNQLATAVPPASDDNANLNYLHSVYATEAQAGVAQLTISAITGPAGATTGVIVPIPVSFTVSGTYDQCVVFLKLLYNLPRLTTIADIGLTNGGPNSSRSTALDMTISADIYANTSPNAPTATAAPSTAPSSITASLPQCSTPSQPAPRDPLDPTLTPQSPLLTVPTCLPAGMPAVAPTTTTPTTTP